MKTFTRSHKGYSRLGKPSSIFSFQNLMKHCSIWQKFSPKLNSVAIVLGHYFQLTTHYAPYALLPTVLLYLNDFWPVLPSTLYITGIVIFFLGVLYQLQDRLLYHPEMPETSRLYVTPSLPSIPHEEVYITTTDNIKLHGYLLKQKEERLSDAPTLVYFHGNAGNCSSPACVLLYVTCDSNVLMIDYRGFGRSTGFPSEDGLYRDGEAAVRYLHTRNDINLNKIVLYGHSLGGAVAIHLASKSQWVKGRIAAVMLENTFASIPTTAVEIFQSFLPFLRFLPTVCFKNKFLSIDKVNDIQVPILFVYGDSDTIVPPSMSLALYQAAGNPRSAIVEVPNGTHNDTWCSSVIYQTTIVRFLRKVFNGSADVGRTWRIPDRSEERTALSQEWLGDVLAG